MGGHFIYIFWLKSFGEEIPPRVLSLKTKGHEVSIYLNDTGERHPLFIVFAT